MLRGIKRSVVVEVIAALFILLFTYTALSKLGDRQGFRNVLFQSPLIGKAADLISWIIPVLELFISLLLFFPKTRKIGLYAATSLMAVFTVYITYMILFEKDLPCSCGGVIGTMNWGQHLVFNILFVAAGGWSLKWFLRAERNKGPMSSPVMR